MNTLDYTTYADIRAILGVSRTEVTDETLSLFTYSSQAELMLVDVYASLPTLYSAIKANPTPTALEDQLEKLTMLYFSYCMAKLLMTALPMFAVQTLEDGRASFTRFGTALDDLKDAIELQLAAIRARLIAVLNTLIPGAVAVTNPTRVHILGVGLGTDPVTGV